MDIRTHEGIDQGLCGMPLSMADGESVVRLTTTAVMAADDRGLVHGGFVFGLADYAAMLAVNDPNVVLGGAETRFLKPVTVGDTLEAAATVDETSGRKRRVTVTVHKNDLEVFQGTFICFILDKHVLD